MTFVKKVYTIAGLENTINNFIISKQTEIAKDLEIPVVVEVSGTFPLPDNALLITFKVWTQYGED